MRPLFSCCYGGRQRTMVHVLIAIAMSLLAFSLAIGMVGRLMNADFMDALRQIEKEKEIPLATLLKTLEVALGKAYKKEYGITGDVTVHIDPTKSSFKLTAEKVVV